MMGGSIPAFTLPVFTAVRSVRCAPPGRPMFRSSRRPRQPKRQVSVPACGAGLRPLRSAAHGSAAGRQLKERCGLSSRTARSMRRELPSNASRLGVGARQLTRLFARYLQASPSEVAKTARVQRAKRLIDETSLPMTEIAMQAGFGSLRRFNSVFAEVYGRPPTEIRRKRFSGAAVLA
jgi:methylphosphotriester-DNA--protein-cysteine methyltransferase